LLDDRRGGYCHEHAVLILTALAELGLAVHPVLARVHLGAGRAEPGGLTHQATIVELGSQRHLVDPGFGGGTPELALPLTGGARTAARGGAAPRGAERRVGLSGRRRVAGRRGGAPRTGAPAARGGGAGGGGGAPPGPGGVVAGAGLARRGRGRLAVRHRGRQG